MKKNKPGSRPCDGLIFLFPELVSGERNSMKSEFEVYMETGILGGYMPERAIGYRDENTITPI